VLAELMGLRDRVAAWFGWDDNLQEYVGRPRIPRSMPDVIDPVGLFTIGGYRVTSIDLLVIGSALLMMMLLDQFVRRSRLGRGIRATAQDPETAALMGVNSTRIIQITFMLGGLMAGVAAFLYMLKIGATKFDVGFLLGVKAFTAAVLGGIGNLRGALLGGLVLGVAENWGQAIFGSEWRDVVAFVLLIIILLFRPTGLLGESLGKART
jgi:branched-chain amino acid transport system permease protein